MAVIIDKNETLMLKEMEKLEKKQLDEATKILIAFQDKFEILIHFDRILVFKISSFKDLSIIWLIYNLSKKLVAG
jgi:hypothetical protein